MMDDLDGEILEQIGSGTPDCTGRYVIRKTRVAHCKRGPALCEDCREWSVQKICLLDTCPPRPGEVQRRSIQLERGGERIWREYEIVRSFESAAEAERYAKDSAIEDVEL